MYAFVFGVGDKCYLGRTWDDFAHVCDTVINKYGLNINRRLIVYVHNLAYEFQYLRKRFEWDNVFSIKERKPIKAVATCGIEFRCSYLLSGYSLATLAKNLVRHKVDKMVGDLDYKRMRHATTPLTSKEKGYILNDGLIVLAYISEEIVNCDDITKIPLTKTGYVRQYCRNECLYQGGGSHKRRESIKQFRSYHEAMLSLQIDGTQEYEQLKRAFHGGFTHASARYAGDVIQDVTSFDETSAYPAVMVMEKFPMGHGTRVTPKTREEFLTYLKKYCCIFDLELWDVRAIESCEHPLSYSKCCKHKGVITDNGRVVEAEYVMTTVTELDFKILRKFYEWRGGARVKNMRIYYKAYLPTPFVRAVLNLYEKKTTLKGVAGKEVEYNKSKEQVNSCFGMSVTDICRDEIEYKNGEWVISPCDKDKALSKYNKDKRRFLCYQWGIWITSYAQYNLFQGIYEAKDDYIYSDTDSIKITNAEAHMSFIEAYNARVERKLHRAMEYHGLPFSMCCPQTKDGKTKMLGVWDFDGHYKNFKTLGAKRYMIEKDDGTFSLTVSGVDKKKAVPYLEKTAKEQGCTPFDLFKEGLVLPKGQGGKQVHTYLDYEDEGVITDYRGVSRIYHELSSVHIEEGEYSLSISDEYRKYLLGVRNERQ